MKIRGDFVTNSSSTSYVFIGNNYEEILDYIKRYKVFSFATKNILNILENKGISFLKTVFKNGNDVAAYIEGAKATFAELQEIYSKYNINASDSVSSDFIKILTGDTTINTDGKVGFIIEVGDNYGEFVFEEVEWLAGGEINSSGGLLTEHSQHSVISFWRSNH